MEKEVRSGIVALTSLVASLGMATMAGIQLEQAMQQHRPHIEVTQDGRPYIAPAEAADASDIAPAVGLGVMAVIFAFNGAANLAGAVHAHRDSLN